MITKLALYHIMPRMMKNNTCILTGFVIVNPEKHIKILGVEEQIGCSFCNELKETLHNIIVECNTVMTIRGSIFGVRQLQEELPELDPLFKLQFVEQLGLEVMF